MPHPLPALPSHHCPVPSPCVRVCVNTHSSPSHGSTHKSVPGTPNELTMTTTTPVANAPYDPVTSTMAALHLSPRVENPNANRFLYHSNITSSNNNNSAAVTMSSSSPSAHSSDAVCSLLILLLSNSIAEL